MKHTIVYLRNGWNLVGFHFLTHYCTDKPEYWVPREGKKCSLQKKISKNRNSQEKDINGRVGAKRGKK
jgi:hypothetical protein